MEIEFSVEEADVLAFCEYHNERSQSAQTIRRRNTYGYGVGFMGFGILLLFLGPTALGVAFLLLGPLWIVYWPRHARHLYQKQAAALWREGRNPIFEGSHVLRLDDTSLVSISAAGESRMPLGTIQRLVTTPHLLLIYVGAVQAIIVPRRRVVRGDVDKFGEEMQRLVGAA
jgi:YcxB-like protein